MSTPIDTTRLPSWFSQAFAHLAPEDLQIAARLWQEEPALRQLAQRLDTYHPDRWKPAACPVCNNTRINRRDENARGIKRYHCQACDRTFTATEGTPYFRLTSRSYLRLYAAAVTLWGPWTPFFAWRIVGCSDTKLMAEYCRRVQALLEEIDPDPLVSRPAYRFGFTPGQQGIRCMRCDSVELTYMKRHDPDNPCFQCSGCGYQFYLRASRRHLLPLPPEVHCPGCEGRNLNQVNREDGRKIYRCRDCKRSFHSQAKKFHPAKYGRQQTRPIPDGVTCPSCQCANIRIFAICRDGRTIYRCKDCSRQFLSAPKRPPTRLKYGARKQPPEAPRQE